MAIKAVAWVDFEIDVVSKVYGVTFTNLVGKTNFNYLISAHIAGCNMLCHDSWFYDYCSDPECPQEHVEHDFGFLPNYTRWQYDNEQLLPKKTDKELPWLTGRTTQVPTSFPPS